LSVAAIIPARYASTRFPGKPLANETGKPLIQHVYEAVAKAQLINQVLVATDDSGIAETVRNFGGEAVMTRTDHVSGTDRVAEAARQLEAKLVINVQGDEPEMDPASIDKLVRLMQERPEVNMGTLACPFTSREDLKNPACVKVVLDGYNNALYFSRSLIPYPRDHEGEIHNPQRWLLHLGMYAYRPAFLQKLAESKPADLEEIEKLEQLRVLYMGEKIVVAVINHHCTGIDTPEQYAAFVERYKAG
jgi:3-deoxy-manno-octulosonate cytidylyltransferase (CMP-KDO synthetase)